MATKVVVAFGPSNVYCGLSPWEADVALGVNGFTHGCPGPLTFIQWSVMAWAITLTLPSSILL